MARSGGTRSLAFVALVFLALGCSGCHACVALLLAGDDEPSTASHDPATPAPAPTATPAPSDTDDPDPAPDDPSGALGSTTPAPTPAPDRPSGAPGPAGRYACMQMRVLIGARGTYQVSFVPAALPGFTIDGAGGYTSSGQNGSATMEGSLVVFTGGSYNGWRGGMGADSTGTFVRFRAGAPSDPAMHTSMKSGDYKCYRQK